MIARSGWVSRARADELESPLVIDGNAYDQQVICRYVQQPEGTGDIRSAGAPISGSAQGTEQAGQRCDVIVDDENLGRNRQGSDPSQTSCRVTSLVTPGRFVDFRAPRPFAGSPIRGRVHVLRFDDPTGSIFRSCLPNARTIPILSIVLVCFGSIFSECSNCFSARSICLL